MMRPKSGRVVVMLQDVINLRKYNGRGEVALPPVDRATHRRDLLQTWKLRVFHFYGHSFVWMFFLKMFMSWSLILLGSVC